MNYVCGHDCVLLCRQLSSMSLLSTSIHIVLRLATIWEYFTKTVTTLIKPWSVIRYYLCKIISLFIVANNTPNLCRWLCQSNQILHSRLITSVLSTQSRFDIDQMWLHVFVIESIQSIEYQFL